MCKNMIYYMRERFAELFLCFFSVFNRTTLFERLPLKLCKKNTNKSGGFIEEQW